MNRGRGLYRSRTDSIIGGVSGGIANYLNTDPVYIRIIFAMLAILGGGGVFIYIILWIAVPIEPVPYYNTDNEAYMKDQQHTYRQDDINPETGKPWQQKSHNRNGSLIAGLALIFLGIVFLVDIFIPRIDFFDLWPLILLVVGIILVREGYKTKNVKNEL